MTSDPRKVGPGIWTSWHILSLNHTSLPEKKKLKENIEWMIKKFPCLECRGHATEYLVNHPIPLDNDVMSLFRWTVDFHNTVNLRLGKDFIELEDAKKMWSGENFCLEDCDGEIPVQLGIAESKNGPEIVYKVY